MENKGRNLKKSQIVIISMLMALLVLGLFVPTSKAQFNTSNEYSVESVKSNIVSNTQYGITITKTVNWTFLGNKERDENGNPYINVNFKLDFTKTDIDSINEPKNSVKLVDLIPTEYEIIKETISSDVNVNGSVDNNEIVFDFSDVKLEKKEYELKFVIKLLDDKVPQDIKENKGSINTSGSSIETSVDSKGSAYFAYGTDNKIELESPQLQYMGNPQVSGANENDGIQITKSAGWTYVDGKERDDDGNPYININFNIDFTSVDVDKLSKSLLTDIIPNEYEIIADKIKASDTGIITQVEGQSVKCDFSKVKIKNKVYTVDIVTKLKDSMVPDSIKEGNGYIYTNGETIDVSENSLGSAYFEYGQNSKIELDSPKILYKSPILDEEEEDAHGVTMTKSASFTEVNGSYTDKNDNPYVEIKFKVDATKGENLVFERSEVTDSTVEFDPGKGIDIVIMIDNFSTMGETRLKNAIDVAETLIKQLKGNSKSGMSLAVGVFSNHAKQLTSLYGSSNKKENLEALKGKNGKNGVTLDRGKSNIYEGIEKGQEMLRAKDRPQDKETKNKVLILLSTGLDEAGNDEEKIIGTTNEGRQLFSGKAYNCIAVQFDLDSSAKAEDVKKATNVMKGLATKVVLGKNNKKQQEKDLYYKSKDASGINLNEMATTLRGLENNTFSCIVTKQVYDTRVYDVIPDKYFTLLEDKISVDDKLVKWNVSDNKKEVEFIWDNVQLEKKVYELKLVTVLDINKLPEEYKLGDKAINTNGSTIDSSVDSLGSSYLKYGKAQMLKLYSPKIRLGERFNVTLHCNGGLLNPDKDIVSYRRYTTTVLPTEDDITYTGYIFAGWYDNEQLKGDSKDRIYMWETGDKEYWAKWIKASSGGDDGKDIETTIYTMPEKKGSYFGELVQYMIKTNATNKRYALTWIDTDPKPIAEDVMNLIYDIRANPSSKDNIKKLFMIVSKIGFGMDKTLARIYRIRNTIRFIPENKTVNIILPSDVLLDVAKNGKSKIVYLHIYHSEGYERKAIRINNCAIFKQE